MTIPPVRLLRPRWREHLVNFTVNELEHVHCGKIVAFAGVEIEYEGFVVQTRGWAVVREKGELAVKLPNYRGKNGRALPAIRNELMYEIGQAILRVYRDGATMRLPDELDRG
jgi:hypothetical protein